jgi:hypothetical protein
MIRLRQIALVADHVHPSADDITAVLGIEVGFIDPAVGKYGLENVVMPVGNTFLEIVAPVTEGTTAGRLLEKRHGNGGYMVILQVEDIDAARALAASHGVRTVAQYDRPDGVFASHLHPRDVGGAILSIDKMIPWERWEWGGPKWKEHAPTDVSVAITAVDVQAEDPPALARRWSEVLGKPVVQAGDSFEMKLDEGTIRFVPARDGRGDGVGAIDVAVRDIAEVKRRAAARGCIDAQGTVLLCGTRVTLVQA